MEGGRSGGGKMREALEALKGVYTELEGRFIDSTLL